MAKLTKTDIEGGTIVSIKKITILLGDIDQTIYKVVYRIDNLDYRFRILDSFSTDEELLTEIYNVLIATDKLVPSITRPTNVEKITGLTGQSVIEPR